MDDTTKLKNALVRILAYVSSKANTDRLLDSERVRIADAIEEIEQDSVEIEQDLAEQRRRDQQGYSSATTTGSKRWSSSLQYHW
jgi:hypothetical protein